MSLRIRPMEAGDIPALTRMEQEIFSMPWSADSFAGLLIRDYHLAVVAEAEGEIAGCAVATLLADEGEIDKVMVAERFRRRGIAARLVDALLAEAKRRGAAAMTLEVRMSNLPAIGLYERAGFVTEGVRPGFYEKPAEDALIMWRRPTITKCAPDNS